jgi:hypothetical protein
VWRLAEVCRWMREPTSPGCEIGLETWPGLSSRASRRLASVRGSCRLAFSPGKARMDRSYGIVPAGRPMPARDRCQSPRPRASGHRQAAREEGCQWGIAAPAHARMVRGKTSDGAPPSGHLNLNSDSHTAKPGRTDAPDASRHGPEERGKRPGCETAAIR